MGVSGERTVIQCSSAAEEDQEALPCWGLECVEHAWVTPPLHDIEKALDDK
jgi:hypothetical protein